ncbi:hypothetical protein GGD70_001232 [Paraburkholderia fungorum]|nr:hypothetical protein [Paraburkholderia fungorum]
MDASGSPGFNGLKQGLTLIKTSLASAVFLAMVDDSAYLP